MAKFCRRVATRYSHPHRRSRRSGTVTSRPHSDGDRENENSNNENGSGFAGTASGLAMAAPAVADKADNAFMMICTALVLFMTIPGIALFYGGLIRGKTCSLC